MAPTDFEVVVAALEEGPGQSQGAREMLVQALPHALEPLAEGCAPHAFQLEVLAAVSGALEEAQRAAQAEREAAVEAVAARREDVAEAEAVAAQAAGALEAAVAHAEAKAFEKDQQLAKVQQAEADFVQAESSTKRVIGGRKKLLDERERVRQIAASVERANTEEAAGQYDDPSAVVVKLLEERSAEKPLIAAAPASLGLPPGARSEFDNRVVEEVLRIVEAYAQSLDAQLDAGEKESRHAEAERLGAWAVVDCEKDLAADLDAALVGVKGALEVTKTTLAAAEADTNKRRAALSAKLIEETLIETRIQGLQYAEGAFVRLRDTPPAKEVAQEAARDVAMAVEEEEAVAPTAVPVEETPAVEAEAPAAPKTVDEPMSSAGPGHQALLAGGA